MGGLWHCFTHICGYFISSQSFVEALSERKGMKTAEYKAIWAKTMAYLGVTSRKVKKGEYKMGIKLGLKCDLNGIQIGFY